MTETDKKTEERIISKIKSKYPDHIFMGEEVCKCAGGCDGCVCVDGSAQAPALPYAHHTPTIHTYTTFYMHSCLHCQGVAANVLSETLTDASTWIIDPIDGEHIFTPRTCVCVHTAHMHVRAHRTSCTSCTHKHAPY